MGDPDPRDVTLLDARMTRLNVEGFFTWYPVDDDRSLGVSVQWTSFSLASMAPAWTLDVHGHPVEEAGPGDHEALARLIDHAERPAEIARLISELEPARAAALRYVVAARRSLDERRATVSLELLRDVVTETNHMHGLTWHHMYTRARVDLGPLEAIGWVCGPPRWVDVDVDAWLEDFSDRAEAEGLVVVASAVPETVLVTDIDAAAFEELRGEITVGDLSL